VVTGPELTADDSPLLVKLLAAAQPLSIQVHPDSAGIRTLATDADTAQLLADSGVKSEVLIALEPFEVLAGLRPAQESLRILSAGFRADHPALANLAVGDFRQAISSVLSAGEQFDCVAALDELDAESQCVMEKVVAKYADDAGVAVAFMMRPHLVQSGDAMFVPAGCLHAYVDGFGVEVMTSSDNVLRLGLTPKPIAVEAALSVVRPLLQPEMRTGSDGAEISVTGFPFTVQQVIGGETSVTHIGSVVLSIDGDAHADCGAHISSGQAAVLNDGACNWRVNGTVFVARPTAGS
jgi:mannose-6-phosphate isomerase